MYYKTLEVKRRASIDEIKTAYKRLALCTHPDKCNGSQERFLQIRKAYEVLIDAQSRREYDALLNQKQIKRAGFMRPANLQHVFKPVQFALADGTVYTFETATHLLRCRINYGDIIEFNKETGYFLGLAGDDYLYWCIEGMEHATRLCHRDSTFALSSINVVQRNYVHISPRYNEEINKNDYNIYNNNNINNSNSNKSTNHVYGENNASTSQNGRMRFNESTFKFLHEETLHKSNATKKTNRSQEKFNKELNELQRIRSRIRAREWTRQIMELLARTPVDELTERAKIEEKMRVGFASLTNMYKFACQALEQQQKQQQEEEEEKQQHQSRKEFNQRSKEKQFKTTNINNKTESANDDVNTLLSYSSSEEQIHETTCSHDKKMEEEHLRDEFNAKINLNDNLTCDDVECGSRTNDCGETKDNDANNNTVKVNCDCDNANKTATTIITNHKNTMNEDVHDDDENDDDDDQDEDEDEEEELFIVHENTISDKLFKSCSTNLAEECTDFDANGNDDIDDDENFQSNDTHTAHECNYRHTLVSSSPSPPSSFHIEHDDMMYNLKQNYHAEIDNDDDNDWEEDDEDDENSVEIEVVIEDLHVDDWNNYKPIAANNKQSHANDIFRDFTNNEQYNNICNTKSRNVEVTVHSHNVSLTRNNNNDDDILLHNINNITTPIEHFESTEMEKNIMSPARISTNSVCGGDREISNLQYVLNKSNKEKLEPFEVNDQTHSNKMSESNTSAHITETPSCRCSSIQSDLTATHSLSPEPVPITYVHEQTAKDNNKESCNNNNYTLVSSSAKPFIAGHALHEYEEGNVDTTTINNNNDNNSSSGNNSSSIIDIINKKGKSIAKHNNDRKSRCVSVREKRKDNDTEALFALLERDNKSSVAARKE